MMEVKRMGIKRKLGALILTSIIVMSVVFLYTQQKPYSTELVMESLWDKYEVQSTGIGITDPVISIDVYDKNDIPEVEKYLKSNLSKDDLEHYEIEIFSRWS
ncbi:hypothetical protein HMPREF9372_3755 [Sporosarcina newyorkensis 2681]|uniref:Uncharacterized protein n=2 Tax=Sporosarcina newyorkensis TaxID=759851 RepID=F9DY74_9BACL|nr:hypothetical protein HMPREF9372_3755 [Sporosarcina newyorkensis 2681]